MVTNPRVRAREVTRIGAAQAGDQQDVQQGSGAGGAPSKQLQN